MIFSPFHANLTSKSSFILLMFDSVGDFLQIVFLMWVLRVLGDADSDEDSDDVEKSNSCFDSVQAFLFPPTELGLLLFIALVAVVNILPFDLLIFPFLASSSTGGAVRLLFALCLQPLLRWFLRSAVMSFCEQLLRWQPRAVRLERLFLALLALEVPAACFSKLLLVTTTRGQPLLQVLTFAVLAVFKVCAVAVHRLGPYTVRALREDAAAAAHRLAQHRMDRPRLQLESSLDASARCYEFGLAFLVCGIALALPVLDGRPAPWSDVGLLLLVQCGCELIAGALGVRVLETAHGVPVRLQWRTPGFVPLMAGFVLLLMFVTTTMVETSVASLVRSTYG